MIMIIRLISNEVAVKVYTSLTCLRVDHNMYMAGYGAYGLQVWCTGVLSAGISFLSNF